MANERNSAMIPYPSDEETPWTKGPNHGVSWRTFSTEEDFTFVQIKTGEEIISAPIAGPEWQLEHVGYAEDGHPAFIGRHPEGVGRLIMGTSIIADIWQMKEGELLVTDEPGNVVTVHNFRSNRTHIGRQKIDWSDAGIKGEHIKGGYYVMGDSSSLNLYYRGALVVEKDARILEEYTAADNPNRIEYIAVTVGESLNLYHGSTRIAATDLTVRTYQIRDESILFETADNDWFIWNEDGQDFGPYTSAESALGALEAVNRHRATG